MKYIKSLVLFAVLVVFPLGSWYYLQSGLDFRKGLMAELEGDGTNLIDLDLPDSISQQLTKKTSLIILDDADVKASDIELIKEQFHDQYTFQLIEKNLGLKGKNEGFAMLIDTSGKVRHEYTDPDNFKKIVEHLAIVIPRKPAKDIVTKSK